MKMVSAPCDDDPPAEEMKSEYLEHLHARDRARRGKATPQDEEDDLAVLPADVVKLCTQRPDQCLNLILQTLEEPIGPELVAAIGDELLENLLNEHSAVLVEKVIENLRTNKRFRQAFAHGDYASVDPAIISDWVRVFQELGTTKKAERKSLWSTAI